MRPALTLIAALLATSVSAQSKIERSQQTGSISYTVIDTDSAVQDTKTTGCSEETIDLVSRRCRDSDGSAPSLHESPSISTALHETEEIEALSNKLGDPNIINAPPPRMNGISDIKQGNPSRRSMNLGTQKQQSSDVKVRKMSTARKIVGAIAVGILVIVI